MNSAKENNGVSLSAMSIMGQREEQQDAYVYRQCPDRTIAIICDGMGGLQGGSAASKHVVKILAHDLERVDLSVDLYGFFQYELEKLDDEVYGLRGPDGRRIGAGTTAVAILLFQNQLHWFSVGDSMLYYIRQGEMHCFTRAHNYMLQLNQKKKNHEISEEVYLKESQKGEQLISYLGMGTAEIFDSNYRPLIVQQGDRLLLCTDGLYRTLSQEEIYSIMKQSGSTERICKLFENAILAKRVRNQDNATWIVIQRTGD